MLISMGIPAYHECGTLAVTADCLEAPWKCLVGPRCTLRPLSTNASGTYTHVEGKSCALNNFPSCSSIHQPVGDTPVVIIMQGGP